MPRTAKVFMTNGSQAVRLPKEFQFATDEVLIRKVGDDPALAGTVVLTTVTDVVGFFSFLGLASLFLI